MHRRLPQGLILPLKEEKFDDQGEQSQFIRSSFTSFLKRFVFIPDELWRCSHHRGEWVHGSACLTFVSPNVSRVVTRSKKVFDTNCINFVFWVLFEGGLTGLLGTLWQVKSHTQRSSSASSSHEPPNMRQRSCSQPSTPEPDPPEPQSALKNTPRKHIVINKTRNSAQGIAL